MEDSAILPHERHLLNLRDDLLLVNYTFTADLRDSLSRETLAAYWRSRRFYLEESREGTLWHGRRGSLLGNLFAFDVRKRLAELLIEDRGGVLNVRLLLDFRFQIVTEWDILDHKLELVLFRAAMERRPLPDYFRSLPLTRLPSQAAWLVFGTLNTDIGKRCPREYHQGLWELAGGELPTIYLKRSEVLESTIS